MKVTVGPITGVFKWYSMTRDGQYKKLYLSFNPKKIRYLNQGIQPDIQNILLGV